MEEGDETKGHQRVASFCKKIRFTVVIMATTTTPDLNTAKKNLAEVLGDDMKRHELI